MNDSTIIINPKLIIGQQIWFMQDNKPAFGLISSYDVKVTSHLDKSRSLYEQLFQKFFKRLKIGYTYTFIYRFKKLNDRYEYPLIEKGEGNFFYNDKKVFLLKENLINSLK